MQHSSHWSPKQRFCSDLLFSTYLFHQSLSQSLLLQGSEKEQLTVMLHPSSSNLNSFSSPLEFPSHLILPRSLKTKPKSHVTRPFLGSTWNACLLSSWSSSSLVFCYSSSLLIHPHHSDHFFPVPSVGVCVFCHIPFQSYISLLEIRVTRATFSLPVGYLLSESLVHIILLSS